VLDEESEWLSSKYFNGNAYPDNVQTLVNACWRRFSLILTYHQNMSAQKKLDTNKFLKWTNHNITKIRIGDKNLAYEISFESIAYISNFYMTLFMIKSFLDIWAKACATLIDPKAKVNGFHKAKIDNESLAGGNLINWLQRCVPQAEINNNLIKLVYDNVKFWVNNAVKYRDQILYHGEVKNIKPMRIIIKEKPKIKYLETDLIQASMPDNTSVLEYSHDIICKLNSFIIECIKLLPNIKLKYLTLEPLIL